MSAGQSCGSVRDGRDTWSLMGGWVGVWDMSGSVCDQTHLRVVCMRTFGFKKGVAFQIGFFAPLPTRHGIVCSASPK